jgi:hypothetical protein
MVRFRGWCRIVISFGNGLDNHSLGKIHSLQVSLCLVLEEWPRVGNGPGSTIRDIHSLGKTHSLQVTLFLVSEEWPRVRNGPGSENQDNYSSLLEKNSSDSLSLMFDFLSADSLSDLTDVSRRMAQIIQFIS